MKKTTEEKLARAKVRAAERERREAESLGARMAVFRALPIEERRRIVAKDLADLGYE